MPHPYQNPNDPNRNGGNNSYADLDKIINNAVRFGSDVGSTVLNSISDALNSVGSGAGRDNETDFTRWRRRVDSRLSGGFGGWMTMGVFGWIFCGSFGIAAFVMFILAGVYGAEYPAFDILAPIFSACTVGFGAMGWGGCHRANYLGRLRQYLRAARDFVVPVRDLSRATAKKSATVQKDLQKAVLDGHYPDACLDATGEKLYLDETLYHQPTRQTEQAKAQEQTQPGITPTEQFRRDGVDFLTYLRSCRGRLDDTADEEIAEMQKNCGAILGFVYNHPEQLPRVRRFQEYYIPTTRKLLDTAMGLGEVDAANAQNIRRDIAGILHTLNIAYKKLYDTLLQDMSLDVSTEIDTLEAMLRQDGLTHDFESDFGLKNQ